MIKVLISLFSFLLAGCSYYADLYIVNSTPKQVSVSIILNVNLEELKATNYLLKLKSTNRILKVDASTIKKLTMQIEHENLNSNTIKFILPPNSTTVIGGGYNGLPGYFEKFIIEQDEALITLTSDELESNIERSGGIFPPFQFTYIFK